MLTRGLREDDCVLHRQRCTNWHRVERAALRLMEVVARLQRDGWQDVRA